MTSIYNKTFSNNIIVVWQRFKNNFFALWFQKNPRPNKINQTFRSSRHRMKNGVKVFLGRIISIIVELLFIRVQSFFPNIYHLQNLEILFNFVEMNTIQKFFVPNVSPKFSFFSSIVQKNLHIMSVVPKTSFR